jgi:hypothetical protein
MSAIGVMNLIYSADTTGLTKGTGKARSEVKAVAGVVEEARSKMGGVLAGLGAALGVGSLGVWVKSSMDAINSTRVMAERLGTSSDALSRLSYAAKIADVDQETLNGSLQKMEKNLAEVALTGGGKAADALARFGLSAADLSAQDPAATFVQLVGALGQIENPVERMKAATDLFGKSAQGILNLAVQGADGLEQMMQEADDLGITISDLDAAKVDEADDAMTRIWETVAGVGRTLAVELSPWITEVATQFIDWAKSGVDAGSYVSQALDWVASGIGFIMDGVQFLQMGWYGLKGVVEAIFSGWLYMIDLAIKGVNTLSHYLTGTDIITTNFAKEMADQLSKDAKGDFAKVGELWGKDWAHTTVRTLVDEVQIGAGSRAVRAVDQAVKFRGGRTDDEIERQTKEKLSFGKAMELGSSDAANTILRTATGGGGKDIKAVADNTRRTADNTAELIATISAWTGMSDSEIVADFSA